MLTVKSLMLSLSLIAVMALKVSLINLTMKLLINVISVINNSDVMNVIINKASSDATNDSVKMTTLTFHCKRQELCAN